MRKNRIQDIYGYKMSRGPRRRPSLIAPNRVQCDIYRCEALSGTGTASTKYDYFEVRQKKTIFQPSMANCFAGIFSLNHGQLKSLPSQQSDKTSLCCFCNIQKKLPTFSRQRKEFVLFCFLRIFMYDCYRRDRHAPAALLDNKSTRFCVQIMSKKMPPTPGARNIFLLSNSTERMTGYK